MRQRDLSSLRLIVTGAAVVPVVLIERLRDELSVETVLTAYGLTEATGTVTMCRQGDDAGDDRDDVGTRDSRHRGAVVDADGNAVATGEPGEVVVRGYNVMKGYFEDPEATAQTIDADGWLHTGDIGVMDARGNVRITDRLKDMYVVGGFNAYPAEIEQVLAPHPGDRGVRGRRRARRAARRGRHGVRRRASRRRRSTPPRSWSWCRERMANFKAPRTVIVVDALPRNASGKVLKFELRASRASGASS